MIYHNITQTIGNTPIIQIDTSDFGQALADVFVKLESFNPGGSVKDRPALEMIKALEEQGLLKPGDTLVEATSGNTGIGLAMSAAALGYKSVFTMPESMSLERRKLLQAFGARLVLTPANEGMRGAIQKAEELSLQPGFFMLRQFQNPHNPIAHSKSTALEIMEDFPKLDYFVSAVGTGGTITGIASTLKAHAYDTKIVAVEPESSPVLSGGSPAPHAIQGIGAGFIPEILDTSLLERIVRVSDQDAMKYSRWLGEHQGILVGISSGAAFAAALRLAKEAGPGQSVLFLAPDNGERYLSTALYEDIV